MPTPDVQANNRQLVRARSSGPGPRKLRPMYLSERFPPRMVLRAIRLCGGADLDIARALGCTTPTLRKIITHARVSGRRLWKQVIKEYDHDHLGDLAVSGLKEAMSPETNPDINDRAPHIKWYLERRNREYTSKQTTTIEGGDKPLQTVNHNLNVLIQGMPPEVQRQLLEQMDAQEERVRRADLRPVDGVVVEQPNPPNKIKKGKK